MKNVHFIAIGGSVMHNMAIALHKKGYFVSGSDDQIFDPAKSRLKNYGLLPEKEGWDETRINNELDAVILGMHAKKDNPELKKARELGIKIYSFPEFLYEQTKHKTRIVIGGSHGKTTITSMVMHVLRHSGYQFDYMVGSQIEGFETMVGLDKESTIAVFEGDEYLSSPLDARPKFHLYKANIALISGIAWDHINVFPTYEEYKEQFRIFINTIEPGGSLVFNEKDNEVNEVIKGVDNIKLIPYSPHPRTIKNGQTFLVKDEEEIPVHVFGIHNMANLEGAKKVCNEAGLSDEQFYQAIRSFKGAAKRLEKLAEQNNNRIFLDFAHAPSKLKATTKAVKEQFSQNELIACMELHSFSSLNKKFLDQYKNTMAYADKPIIFVNPKAIEHKNLEMLTKRDIKTAFNSSNVEVYFDKQQLIHELKQMPMKNKTILFMSSGNFDGINFNSLANELISKSE